MAALEITVQSVDHGTATGQSANLIKRLTYKLDTVYQEKLILIIPDSETSTIAAATYRTHLTNNGITWTSESPVIII